MLSFRVDDEEAAEAQRWAERLGVDRSELLREALRRHIVRLASENDARTWTDQPLNPDKFFPWVQDLVANEGPNILRSKGILSFKDDPERFVFQGVHMMLDGDHQRAWHEGEPRESRIVFIGRNLKKDLIRKGFEACRA